jgi:hypothetical protein
MTRPTDPRAQLAHRTLEQVCAQREEILVAFVAKYNCQPEDAIQVIQTTSTEIRYSVRKTTRPTDAELAALLRELLFELSHAAEHCELWLEDATLPDRARAAADQLTGEQQ